MSSGKTNPIDIKKPLLVGGGTAGALWLVQKMTENETGTSEKFDFKPMTLFMIGAIAAGATMVEPYVSGMLETKSS